jgi:hypothetical protein
MKPLILTFSRDKQHTDRLYTISQSQKLGFDSYYSGLAGFFSFGTQAANIDLNTIPEKVYSQILVMCLWKVEI